MILQCPNCQARFLVNDALIPLEGRDVRCGHCKNTWFVSPNPIPMDNVAAPPPAGDGPAYAEFDHALASATADEAEDMAMSAGSEAQLPVIQPLPFSVMKALLPTVGLLVLTVFVALAGHYPDWKNAPVAGGIYRAFGYTDTQGLAFADINLVREQAGAKTQFLVSGNIINRNDTDAVVPKVRVKLLDKEGKTIWSRNYDVNRKLNADDIYPFRITNVETTFADKVAQVMLDLGNGYELMVR